ncbi:MAG: hypothetical protein C0504_04740 [Candidatus Solibacter sp.]|nr:hypothetical protein [Candidatus Solibacter sp.]
MPMNKQHMPQERIELGEILRFQESLLRLVTVNRSAQEEPAPRRPVAAEKIAEMARKVSQAS